jgi:putative hydrolase of the HAD superfamily
MSALYREAGSLFVPPPRALLLDAGFTLTFYDGASIAAHAAREGVTVDASALERAEEPLRGELRERPGVALRTHDDGGNSWLHRFFRRLLELAGAQGSAADLDRAAATINREHFAVNVWCRVGAGVREALSRLRERGLALAVVSNSEGTIDAMLTAVGLRPFFDVVIDSAVVGVAKPDARIFEIALGRLGVAPADAIMIGDSPTGDIHGAAGVGIRTALLDPFDFYPWMEGARFRDLPAFADALLASPRGA